MSQSARYLTVRDYLRVLRRYWLAILVIAIAGAAAGFAVAKSKTTKYQATSQVSFQDPAQSLTLVGLGTGNVQFPAQVAQDEAATLTRPQVMAAVQQALHTNLPQAELASLLSSSVSSTGFLQIAAESTQPALAVRLTNAVANVIVTQSNQQTRSGFASAARDIQQQITSLRVDPHNPASISKLTVLGNELAPLLSLSKVAQSATIEQLATGVSLVRPSATSNALIGGGIGLLLGILAAFLRDTLDRRVRTTREVEDSYELPILGYVRRRAMGKVAWNANSKKGDHSDMEAFRILRRNLDYLRADSRPKSILVTSAVPGEGKTTVAASLAFAAAAGGRSVLLVEGDLRRPVLAKRLGIPAAPGLSEYLSGSAKPEDVMRVIDLPVPGRNGSGPDTNWTAQRLVCIPAGQPTSRGAELLGSELFKEFLQQVSAVYDTVVIDTTPLLPLADALEILPQADAVLVCARATKTKRDEAQAVAEALARFPSRPTGVVVTGIKPRSDDYRAFSYSYSYS